MIFLLVVFLWVFELIFIYFMLVVIIVFEVLMFFDKGFILFWLGEGISEFGVLLKLIEIMVIFVNFIIMLFLGGFFFVMVVIKYWLDVNLVCVLFKLFGNNLKYVMLGLMMIIVVFLMFMLNIVIMVMMFFILMLVIVVFGFKDLGCVVFVFCILVVVNIGGIGIFIGMLFNVIVLKYLVGDNLIMFVEWMVFGILFVVILMVFVWLLIEFMYCVE